MCSSPDTCTGAADETLIATFNDLASVRDLFAKHAQQVACIILEPMMGNHGTLCPSRAFLQARPAACDVWMPPRWSCGLCGAEGSGRLHLPPCTACGTGIACCTAAQLKLSKQRLPCNAGALHLGSCTAQAPSAQPHAPEPASHPTISRLTALQPWQPRVCTRWGAQVHMPRTAACAAMSRLSHQRGCSEPEA